MVSTRAIPVDLDYGHPMSETQRAPAQRWVELGEQQRTAVVEAVLAMVTEGSTDLTVAELAQRAGISRPTFYKYFPTLGAAMLHTQRVLLARIDDYVVAHLDDGPNARERLLAIFDLSFDYTCTHPELARFFNFYDYTFRRFGLAADEQTEYLAIVNETGAAFLDLFAEGQRDGSIRPDLPVEETYLALQTSVVGARQRLLIETRWTNGADDRAREVHTTILTVWRQALTPRSSTR
jgi:AcrR family transcriptional regulator